MISNFILVYSTVYLIVCCSNQVTNAIQALKVDKRGAAYPYTICETDGDCYNWQVCIKGNCNFERQCILVNCRSIQKCYKNQCFYLGSLVHICDGARKICVNNMDCTADVTGTKKCVCTMDSDCPDDSWCRKSSCISRQSHCTDNSGCHADSHCVNGHCIAQRYGKCSSKANCDSGLECIRGKCEYYCPGYGVCFGDLRCYNETNCIKASNLHKNCSSSDMCQITTENSICDLSSHQCRCSDGFKEELGIKVVFCKKVFQMPLYGTIVISIVVVVILVLFIKRSYIACRQRVDRIARRGATQREAAITDTWIAAPDGTIHIPHHTVQ